MFKNNFFYQLNIEIEKYIRKLTCKSKSYTLKYRPSKIGLLTNNYNFEIELRSQIIFYTIKKIIFLMNFILFLYLYTSNIILLA